MIKMSELERAEETLSMIPQSVVKTKTETIARVFGKPKAENFISDWFAFLLRNNSKVVEALLCSAGYEFDGQEFEVNREYIFSDGRRIDFLLKSETTIIGIENKIDSGKQDNQLEDYSNELEEMEKGKNIVKIFLKPSYNVSKATSEFIEVNYEDLIEEMKKIPLDFISDLRGSFFLLDFIKHIEENIIIMEQFEFSEWTSFLAKHQKDIATINHQSYENAKNIRSLVKEKMFSIVDEQEEWNVAEHPTYIQFFKEEWSKEGLPFIHFELLNTGNVLPTSYLIRLDIEGKRNKKEIVNLLGLNSNLHVLHEGIPIDYTNSETFYQSIDETMEVLKGCIEEWVPKIESAIAEIAK
ncbi:PD-(D/E)XK nuclease superfamily protein [Pilibacter termitis]|uniref:PD-(D/E)XK nuclease superfamily protein n=1 Tax=Pilibacter termitis TaxID=263852 RepID=A0A1T4Q3X6_9ENTE|nr:PD-(D/E)XK nuclease family protein [Pilibacter termitis]SJZ97908.1 PD-(D/E)XK nuclease superfamily protein [Pilibacter termitis]